MMDDELHVIHAANRGPVETRIESMQKHNNNLDIPNYSLNLLIPKNEKTLKFFKRYQKFYLWPEDETVGETCWRVEAVNNISMTGVIEVNAVEYYSNKFNDDIDAGLADVYKDPDPIKRQEIIESNKKQNKILAIEGETFIKPKISQVYSMNIKNTKGTWSIEGNHPPVKILEQGINEQGFAYVKIKWDSTYSGQFDLAYGTNKKTIVVESLF